MGTTPIYGFPYPDASDLVANYPALGQQLAEDVEDAIYARKILQIVRATDVTSRGTSSTSFVDVTGMAVTITPQVSTSIILVWAIFFGAGGGSTAGDRAKFQITLADNTALSGAEQSFLGSTSFIENIQSQISLLGRHEPGSTSAITYKMRFGTTTGSATATIGNNTNTGQVYAIEVSA